MIREVKYCDICHLVIENHCSKFDFQITENGRLEKSETLHHVCNECAIQVWALIKKMVIQRVGKEMETPVQKYILGSSNGRISNFESEHEDSTSSPRA